ncbi:hypothetical protein HYY69_06290 [Candidatus Woesearchaeota archaeon]|nr:hypothetical protein [Candidatus Woesearchaeota archaeon]
MKKPISATIDSELIDWLDKTIKKSSNFRNKSHLIETALEKLKKEMK